MTEMRVVRSIDVPVSQADAFALWVDHFGTWWPLATHSFGQAQAVDVVLDGRPGGAITERWHDGTSRTWGVIAQWDPPNRIRHSWYLGFTPDQATDVEVRFESIDANRTRVTVTQTGFERLGAAGPQRRDGNEKGWATVLDHYLQSAAPPA